VYKNTWIARFKNKNQLDVGHDAALAGGLAARWLYIKVRQTQKFLFMAKYNGPVQCALVALP
jgi:hypothetical protein